MCGRGNSYSPPCVFKFNVFKLPVPHFFIYLLLNHAFIHSYLTSEQVYITNRQSKILWILYMAAVPKYWWHMTHHEKLTFLWHSHFTAYCIYATEHNMYAVKEVVLPTAAILRSVYRPSINTFGTFMVNTALRL